MPLTPLQMTIMILAVAAGTLITRFAPFLLFPEGRRRPEFVLRLGKLLPPAMMGLLVVYCLRSVSLTAFPFGLPELIAVAVTAALQLWKKNVLISILAGTVLYMVLIQTVFSQAL